MAQTQLLALVLVCLMSWLDVATSLAHSLLPVRLAKMLVYFLSPFGHLLFQLHRRTLSRSSPTDPQASVPASPDYRVDSGFNTPISGSAHSGKPLAQSPVFPSPNLPSRDPAGPKDRDLPSLPGDPPVIGAIEVQRVHGEEGGGAEEEDFLIFAGVRCITQDDIQGPGAQEMVREMRRRIDASVHDPTQALNSSLLMVVLARFFAIHPLPGLEDYLHDLIDRVGSLQDPQGKAGPSHLIYTLHTLALATYARARQELGLPIPAIYLNHWPANTPLKRRLELLSHLNLKDQESDSLLLYSRALTLRAGAEVAQEVADVGAATWYLSQAQSHSPDSPSLLHMPPAGGLDTLLALSLLSPRSHPPLDREVSQTREHHMCRVEDQMDQRGLSSLSTPHLVMYSMAHLTE